MSQTQGLVACRSVFISDIHLGTRGCRADLLLEFIRELRCEKLYLVGDIVDGWKMAQSGFYWPQTHNDVVQKLLRLSRKGVEVIYVPGNHDHRVRDFCGVHFGGVRVLKEAVHTAADGRRYLVVHGDAFDGVVQQARWLAKAGDIAYRLLLASNSHLNGLQKRLGLSPWSLAAFMKARVKQALQFIDDFERSVARAARDQGLDGVICGHIHKAEMREIDGIAYINDGDWVESCTAAIEHHDGRFELIDWRAVRNPPVAAAVLRSAA